MSATKTRRRWTLAACAVLVGLAVVAVAYQGAPQFSGPRMFLPPAPLRTDDAGRAAVTGTPEPAPVHEAARIDLSWVVFAVIVLLVVIALAVLWRRLRHRLAPPELAPLPVLDVTATDALVEPPAPEKVAAVVRRGLDRALDALQEQREPRDAIEAAWVGLEEGAADSGIRRLPAETPGEFSARVVARVDADREAARLLLALYLRARFSEAPISAGDVDAARRAVETLQRSWGAMHRGGTR